MSGDDELLYPLGRRCCGATDMSDCHQYGLCLAIDIHPELAALRAKADAADRVRALAETWERRAVTYAAADDRDTAHDLSARSFAIRRALDGPSPC